MSVTTLTARAQPARVSTRRAVDLLVVMLAALVVVPVVAILALAIKLDSRGPVFWAHRRPGRDGRPFPVYKLRTMVADADEMKASLNHLNVLPWPDFKIVDDPRVTRIGRFLRKTSLDELPQLYNVARGDMTLVGPRPCSIPVGHYETWQLERLEATPGLFGLWQAAARGQVDFAERCRMDIHQIRTRSFRNDTLLVFKTLVAVVRRHGGV